MKKLITFVLMTILVISLLGACGTEPRQVIDKEPVDVRHTEAFSQVETDYEYKYNVWKGEFQLVPNTRTVHYDEKWEIKWLLIYDDESKTAEWQECTEENYYIIKQYLDSGSCEGFRGLDGDSDD